ncbi:hypothetical protein V2J09_016975 [Rumex salicifolius]
MAAEEEDLVEEQMAIDDEDEEDEGGGGSEEEEGENPTESQEWESLAREWLANLLSESRAVTMSEVETWITSNKSSLPEDLLSLTQSELLGRFSAIQSSLIHEQQETKQSGRRENPARFQRTNLWLPVYSWLESLDTDEVIKSKEISDWLAANPEIRDKLSAKHSRYHLMHYIKKCHMKILKKRGKFKGDLHSSLKTSLQAQTVEASMLSSPTSYNSFSSLQKDSDLHIAKRNEALQKYEILVELEKQLAAIVPKH